VEYSDVGLSRSYYYMCSVKHKGIVNCFKVQQFSKLPIEFNADENEAVRAQSLQWHILYKCPRTFIEWALCTSALLPELKPAPCFLSAIIGQID